MKKYITIFFALIFTSCSSDITKYGKISPYNSSTFLFKVEEGYLNANKDSKPDKDLPIMSVAEAKLLNKLMVLQKYCIGEKNKPTFVITSKQEKIFDTTFASLIEQSYNAKPVAPRIYFGKCI